MKTFRHFLALILLTTLGASAGEGWTTDLEKALAKSKKETVSSVGGDWWSLCRCVLIAPKKREKRKSLELVLGT